MREKLVIDARMLNHSGIGTYLRNIIPFLKNEFDLVLLGNKIEIEKEGFHLFSSVVEFNAPIFSIKEQFLLPILIPKCNIFWSPHYNIPFFPIRARKRVVTLHDAYYFAFYDSLSFVQKVFIKISAFLSKKFSKIIFTVSEFSKKELIRYIDCPETKLKVVYNGIDIMYNSGFIKTSIGFPYVLFVGNVKPHKNLVKALEAFRILKETRDNIKFVIVGKKEGFITGEKNLGYLIETLKNDVIFTGYISIESLKNFYANASVFLFPSRYEGFGIPLLEAMTFNIPIVASDIPPLREVGANAVHYCNPLDEKDILEKLEDVISGNWNFDPILYNERITHFTWNKVANKHINEFKRI